MVHNPPATMGNLAFSLDQYQSLTINHCRFTVLK